MKGYQLARQLQRERKYQEALSVLLENEDDGDCCYFLAYLYENGYWGLPRDEKKRSDWLVKGIGLGHDKCILRKQQLAFSHGFHELYYQGENLYCKGTMFCSRGEMTQSLEYYIKSANEGDDFACKQIVKTIWFDLDKVFWMKKGIELGNIECFHLYGVHLLYEKDPSCVNYLRISAEQGCVYSKNYLVDYFINSKDIGKAFNWYKDTKSYCVIFRHHEIFKNTEQCQRVCYQILMIRNFRESNLSVLPKDVVRLIAKILWNTKEEACWEPKNRVSPAILRKKRRIKK